VDARARSGDPAAAAPARYRVNVAAHQIELTREQVDALDNLTPPQGESHNDAEMAMIDR
jgi:hypothetical protein